MPSDRPQHEPHAPTPEPTDGVMRLATLSHELSNLLDGSLRCLTLARSDLLDGFAEADALERAKRRLETITISLERMASLVDGAMRDGSRAFGRPGGPVAQLPLAQSIGHVVDVLTPLAQAALTRLEASFDGGDNLPTGPLYTPVLNAVQNAIQAIDRTGRPGVVRITCCVESAPTGDELVIRVRDSGPGVPTGFRPFSTLPSPGGHGIGLALSAAIVHGVGGSVQITNAEDGRGGAVFTLRCPVNALTGARSEAAR